MEPILASNTAASSKLSWKVVNASKSEATIDIWDTIGDPYDGTTAKDFVETLRGIDAEKITLNINSPGGYVNDALAMYQAILDHPAEITARITVAASAASFVAMAADRRLISSTGKFMIHDAMAYVGVSSLVNAESIDGLLSDLKQAKAILDEESQNIAGIYAERAGGTADEWRAAMRANGTNGTTYRGQAAVDAGLADEVMSTPARNVEPAQVVAIATEHDFMESMKTLPPLSGHVGYQKPVPDLAGLFAKHPLQMGGK